MKELFLSLCLSFGQDFNTNVPQIEFAFANLDTLHARADFIGNVWMVTVDSSHINLKPQRFKTLVYHEFGHIVFGWPDSEKRLDFMNPSYCIEKWERIRNKRESVRHSQR